MKKPALVIGVLALSLILFTQEIQHETIVVNIEVPVRVFKGGKFVDELTVDDFEVYEDGKSQKVVALYLINKTIVKEIKTGEEKFTPKVSRHFFLVFELIEYLPKIGDVIDYFFTNVILPGDTLHIATPIKTYNFNNKAFGLLPKEEMASQLKKKLRKDIMFGSSKYKNLLRDYEEISTLRLDSDLKLQMKLTYLRQLRELTYFDLTKFLKLADYLKKMEGQKYVFLFYQKETMPIPEELGPTALELFELQRIASFDVEKVKQAFSDSSISSHFVYITEAPRDDSRNEITGEGVIDQSPEIFSAFKEMAYATGGTVESSANVASSFQKVVDASESYYVLYYRPSNYKKDGKFHNIKVKVKNRNYRVTHRAGYFAN
jgi:VWFA-related protein